MPLPLSTVRYLRTRVKERGQGYVFTKEKYILPFLPKLRRMFQIFDDDGSGEIDLLELEAALYDYNEIPKKEIVRLLSVFRELDGVKDDGQISFDEFVSVMKTSKSSTNLHRRTRAVIGRKIDLPKPPFPISTW